MPMQPNIFRACGVQDGGRRQDREQLLAELWTELSQVLDNKLLDGNEKVTADEAERGRRYPFDGPNEPVDENGTPD